MAEKFQPQTFDINSINNGNRFGYEGIQPEAVNAPIEAAAYMQALATNQPDNSEAGLIGQPNVSIEQAEDGTPRFKFSNLKAPDHLEKIEQIEKQTNDNSQQLNNLTAALLQNEILTMVEVEQAFVSRETADGESIVDGQYTAPTKIQGDTVACENLLSIGSLDLNGVQSHIPPIPLDLKGTYTFSFKENISSVANPSAAFVQIKVDGSPVYMVVNLPNGKQSRTVTGHITEIGFLNWCNAVGSVTEIMLNKGDTALPYQPYFTGLKNAYFKGIKSTGKNLFDSRLILDAGWQQDGGVFYGVPSYLGDNYGITSKGIFNRDLNWTRQVYISFDGKTANGDRGILFGFVYTDDTRDTLLVSGTDFTHYEKISLQGKTIRIIYLSYATNDITYIKNIQVKFYDEDNTAYEPYKEEIYELPEAVELGKWDSLNLQASELTKANGQIVLDGSNDENWILYGSTETVARYWTNILDNIVDLSIKERGISNKFRFALGAKDIGTFYIDGNGHSCCFNVDITQYPTLADWKAHLAELYAAGTPLIVEYKKATPTVETLDNIPKSYQAWENGSETVVQGDTDNSEYGAMPTVTTEYFKLTEV